MVDLTPQEMAGKLLAGGFSRNGPAAQALSAPIVETPMIVTLDELFPYELNPRITRNPRYEEIKASIRERGLDAPPSITRRPGADHYIIRNGGNTRLAILRELWLETKDERLFRIYCLFRPWSERGEIIALTGHLAEGELHGGLTFIERALGIEKARELYEQEVGKPLSQSELARRLSADGYPIQQSHISRMRDTVRYLLPAIPSVLYKGLGRHQVERLAVLRKAAELHWQKSADGKLQTTDFETLFHDVLVQFDAQPEAFSVTRVRDELIGQMADILGADYNVLDLEIDGAEHRQRAVTTPPPTPAEDVSGAVVSKTASYPSQRQRQRQRQTMTAALMRCRLPRPIPCRSPRHHLGRERRLTHRRETMPPRSCGNTSSRPSPPQRDCRLSSKWSLSIPVISCRHSRTMCYRQFPFKSVDSSRSPTSGTSTLGWIRQIACVSTSCSSHRKSPRRPI